MVAENKSKLVKLVAKMLEMTQEGELKWSLDKTSVSDPSQTKTIGVIFKSSYNGKNLKIYKREYDNTEENHMYGGIYASGQSSYTISIVLGFFDDDGNLIWRFPHTTGISDLYTAVSYQVADIDNFSNDLLDPFVSG